MPRPPRYLYVGGIYHVIARGNNKMCLFHDKQDYRFYRKLWRKAKEKYALRIYRWCLMTNHIHFIIRQQSQNSLPNAMHYIQQRYAKYYGQRYKWVGHVWQGRYTSRLIADDAYLLQCGRYVENNPVRAGLSDRPENYPWSSAYARMRGFEDDLTDKFSSTSNDGTPQEWTEPSSDIPQNDGDPWKNNRRVLASPETSKKLSLILGHSLLKRRGRPST